jgi:epoxide hydrolase-like predicted phosphatase
MGLMIKAICFDLDGVLFTEQSFRNFMKNLPKEINDPEKVEFVLYKSPQMQEFKSGKIDEDKFWNFAKEELKITVDIDDIRSVFQNSYVMRQEVVDYVKKVRKAGYKTCVCSNNFPTRINALQKKLRFLDYFDTVVLSYQVGFKKPAKEIFQALINKSGFRPEEIVFADDNESRLTGAKELGINTFVYENFDNFVKNLKILGVQTF